MDGGVIWKLLGEYFSKTVKNHLKFEIKVIN